ncbi:MAG: hypothetical protein ACKO3M_14020 [Rubrivivax sp.]
MRRATRTALVIALLALLPALGVVMVLSAALQREPAVVSATELAADDVARAVSLLRTHDPRQAVPGRVSAALLKERELEVLLSHGARRWLPGTSGRVDFARGSAQLHLSTHLGAVPLLGGTAAALAAPFGRWVNLEVELQETGGLPAIASARVGSLPLPAWAVEALAQRVLARSGLAGEWQLAQEVVRRVRFEGDHALVVYAWQPDSASRMMASLLSAEDLERLKPYQDRLAAVVAAAPGWQMPMVAAVSPLFELAAQRSAAGRDAAAENRAALVVLTLFVNGRHVGSMAPAAQAWARPRPLRLTRGGRIDFPQQFLVSAALVTEGTSPLSRAIGVYKEVADSRGGSGFSFNDMAANRAGTRFGELALRQPQELQRRVAPGADGRALRDDDLLPAVADLPEFMPEAEFRRRFGGVGAPAYQALLSDIERRVAGLPLLR